jgi:hypothetical protein
MQNLRHILSSLTLHQRWWLGGAAAAVLILFVAVIIVAGSGDEPLPTTTTRSPSTTTSSTTTATTAPSTTTTLGAADTWPLTGLPTAETSPGTPILAVKIDNTANGRPQEGLEMADLVFDIPVEGGISRLLAFFQSRLPLEIGPVRSVREVDPKLLMPFGAFMAHSGGNEAVVASIREVAVDLGQPVLGTVAYRRAGDRPALYDLMLDPEAALATVDDVAEPEESWLSFGDIQTEEPAGTIEINSSNVHEVVYGYSAADGGYLRFHRSQPHLAGSGDQLVAANVVVLVVKTLETGRTDSTGAPVPDFDVHGEGEAVVFREGFAWPGRWERDQNGEFFRFVDPSGLEINLAAGATWIHLVPEGRTYEWR